jgi:drug/metabolite transporter (DMT)-like permease
MATPGRDDRSLGELFSELSREMGTLVRKELELATTEMTAKAKIAGGHVGIAAVGGALAHAGLLILLAALVIGLAQLGITPWLAAVIVGVLTIGVGYLLASRALTALRQTSVAPTQAIEAMKENSTWTTRQKV